MEIRLISLLGILLILSACLALKACAVVSQPRFGKLPEGDYLARIKASPNYGDGQFQNLTPTPKFSGDAGLISILWSGFFDKAEGLVPDSQIPVVKTDLKSLSVQEDTMIWLGHSSWFVQLDGKRFLIDPVLSESAAPFSFLNRAFAGTSIYAPDDLPDIDTLLISHDHWDHLDYPTVTALEWKIKQVICPLGVGAYFEYWGYAKEKILEGDWFDKIFLDGKIIVHVLPARHYSGRLFKENQTLWAGFAIESPGDKIFYSGDSGYGPHFSKIGKLFNGFDLVILDCGQYDSRWAHIHMTPEEAMQAAKDLGAKALAPSHVGRFTIANHPWDEPFKRLGQSGRDISYQRLTPRIGEPVSLNGGALKFSSWWEQNDDLKKQ